MTARGWWSRSYIPSFSPFSSIPQQKKKKKEKKSHFFPFSSTNENQWPNFHCHSFRRAHTHTHNDRGNSRLIRGGNRSSLTFPLITHHVASVPSHPPPPPWNMYYQRLLSPYTPTFPLLFASLILGESSIKSLFRERADNTATQFLYFFLLVIR